MAAQRSYTASSRIKGRQYGGGKMAGDGGFVDRNLAGVNPKSQQFEPTTAQPVRQRFKMGGGC